MYAQIYQIFLVLPMLIQEKSYSKPILSHTHLSFFLSEDYCELYLKSNCNCLLPKPNSASLHNPTDVSCKPPYGVFRS